MSETAKAQALQLVAEFRARGAQPSRANIYCVKDGIWLNVCRNKVADGLEARIKDPNVIAQLNTNVCGIAAFVRDWAEDDPVSYAWLGICLYEAGWGRIGRGSMLGKVVKPSSHLKNYPIPHRKISSKDLRGDLSNADWLIGNENFGLEMNHADWIILASVRESFNKVLAYTANDPMEIVSGMTFPGEVVNAFKVAGYTNVVDWTHWDTDGLTRGNGLESVKEASRRVQNNERVVLLINMRMLKDSTIDTQAAGVATSDHWVGLLDPIEVKMVGQEYQVVGFHVFTWGEKRRIPQTSTYVPLTAFLKNYYGFIAAKY